MIVGGRRSEDRRMRAVAERVSAAWSEIGWSWQLFDEILSKEMGLDVRTLELEFTSGRISGVSVYSDCGERVIIMVPDSASLMHRIHAAAHEAWHLIEGHHGCVSGRGEDAAESFAFRVGERVAARERCSSATWNWLETVGAV